MWPTEVCRVCDSPHGLLQLQQAWGGGSCVRSIAKKECLHAWCVSVRLGSIVSREVSEILVEVLSTTFIRRIISPEGGCFLI